VHRQMSRARRAARESTTKVPTLAREAGSPTLKVGWEAATAKPPLGQIKEPSIAKPATT